MNKYRITKYNPNCRNKDGYYKYDHWTEISDVGKILSGELVTEKEYIKVESDYINAVLKILKESNQKYLRLVGYNKEKLEDSILVNNKEWFHLKEFENLNLYEDKKVLIDEIPTIIQLNLRNYFNTTLEIKNKFYVQFGYDFYMYVGTPKLSNKLSEELNLSLVFLEEFYSPYYSQELDYVIQITEKSSNYVIEEKILYSATVEKMKAIFNLSEEHPGNIYAEITNDLADKINFEVDLNKFNYFLTTKLII